MTTITCTGCGGERRMTLDQIDVPRNGLCEMELDSCPSDQELLLEEALYAIRVIAHANFRNDAYRAYAKDVHEELNKMLDFCTKHEWESEAIYTPTPYHQTGGTTPAENNNKEE